MGPGRAEERQRSAKKTRGVVVDATRKTGETRTGSREKKRRQESVGSIDVDPGYYLENRLYREEAGRQAQGAQGLGPF